MTCYFCVEWDVKPCSHFHFPAYTAFFNVLFFSALLTLLLGVCRVHQEINHFIDKLHIEQNCQLGLIHGSHIDWSSDPELCKHICELGQPVVQRVD